MQSKSAVIERCFASNVHHHALRIEAPSRRFQPASGHHPALNNELVRTGAPHHFAGKRQRTGRGQHHASRADRHSQGCYYIVQHAGLLVNVVCCARSLDMLVVRTAFEPHVAAGIRLASAAVVLHLIGIKPIAPVINFSVAMEGVGVALFFKADGGDVRCVALGRGTLVNHARKLALLRSRRNLQRDGQRAQADVVCSGNYVCSLRTQLAGY